MNFFRFAFMALLGWYGCDEVLLLSRCVASC